MFLDFQGYKLTKSQETMIQSAASHALDFLVSKRMKNTLEITITVEKDLIYATNVWGDMMVDDESRSPKLFEVRLNYSGTKSFGILIKVLCHELVHVSQFATRRLRNLACFGQVGFLNRRYDTYDIDYYERPWEIEAHDLEGKVYDYVIEKDQKIKDYIKAKEHSDWTIDAIPAGDI